MPNTPLTDILKDFRSYRPGNHREFLEWVHKRAEAGGVRAFAMGGRSSAGEFDFRGFSFAVFLVLFLSDIVSRIFVFGTSVRC